MDDLERTVAEHAVEIRNLKEAQRASEERIMATIRDVQADMRAELAKYDERLNEIRSDVKGIRSDLNGALDEVRRATPAWVGPLIGVLVAVGGWLLSVRP